jgi:peptidoglycan/LPS O-acetylase OafA/YrhL
MPPERLALVDVLKAFASQLIVWHHLALYGPLAESGHALLPTLMGWVGGDARMVVQVFLVVAGFLTARSLAPTGRLQGKPLALITGRYRRLVGPYLAALVLSLACAALARQWMVDDATPAAPSIPQLAAHALLLQDLLDHEALSAGVWYVAIDFQLFVVFVLVAWACRCALPERWSAAGLFSAAALLGLASMLGFNRDPAWDAWALYFFGAYALGLMAWWTSGPRVPWQAGAIVAAAALLAWWIDPRPRLMVALICATLLCLARRSGHLSQWGAGPLTAWLGRISYAVFLVHFPILLVVNAAFVRWLPDSPAVHAAGLLTAWAASLAVGEAFNRWVERPLTRPMRVSPRPAPAG